MKYIFFLCFMVFLSLNINADDVNEIESAYATQTSDLQVNSSGTVVKLLPDDNKGSRHQRFILKLSNNQTVLIAHNIDLAPKITSLRRGDVVEFNGEYELNSKGGVIHWTHHDPAGRHQDGWLKHNGSNYE
jgi:hypothetical protein